MLKTVRDFATRNKKVLLRSDFNVPIRAGKILDDFRIVQSCPTIEYLIKEGAKIILISHLGRPSSKLQKYSLKPIAIRLEKLLGQKVKFLDDCIGQKIEKEIAKMKAGDIVLLENLRFYKGEEKNNKGFTEQLAKLGDIFIQDGFAVCHRRHSSIIGLSKFLPSGLGFLVEKELKVLTQLKNKPKRPLIAIIGGAKVKTKAKLIDKISKTADFVLIGNLIKNELRKENIKLKNSEKIIKPIDAIIKNGQELDIGPKTIRIFKEKISLARTIFWNGPLGRIEEKRYSQGSLDIAKRILNTKAYSVVGGGETIAFLHKYNLRDKFSFVSTGGGAMLAYLSGGKLQGVEVLRSEI